MRTVRKIFLVGLALFGVMAFSAVVVSSAFAEESKILAGGNAIVALLPILIEGELLWQDTGATPALNLDCSFKLDGWIEPGGTLGYISDLLMLGGELLNELGVLNGAGNDMIDCAVLGSEVCSKNEVLVTVNLNGTTIWHIELVLDTAAYLVDFLNLLDIEELLEGSEVVEPVYTVDCETILGLAEDHCEGLSSARLYMDLAGNLRMSFNSLSLAETWGAESQLINCTLGGAGTGSFVSIAEGGAAEDTETSGALITDSGDSSALTLSP
jgi:hypothetical protein